MTTMTPRTKRNFEEMIKMAEHLGYYQFADQARMIVNNFTGR